MSIKTLGIIGGGQLGSLLAVAAKKLNINTIIYCDDVDAPAQNFCNKFIHGKYDDKNKMKEFINEIDIITYEFENIPYETLNEMNKVKPVLPKPSVNRLIQHRIAEKDFVNKLNIRTTRYASIENKSDMEPLGDFLPGMISAITSIPVLGVPGESKKLKGLDSLLSIAQMPKGIPVGTLAIGEDGAINAALLAAAIIANSNPAVKRKLNNWRSSQTR